MEADGGQVPVKVLLVSYPFARVRGDTAGGAEHVLASLDRALSGAGHESYLVAPEESEVCGALLPVPLPKGLLDVRSRQRAYGRYASAVVRALERWKPDLVHLH